MSGPANFHCLKSRLRMLGVLEMRTALHVGTSDTRDSVRDMPVLRNARGYPFIPGASLKGVLRSTIEALLRAHEAAVGREKARAIHAWACDPTADESDGCGKHEGDKRNEGQIAADHCAACRLFGSRWLASHVRLSDLQPSKDVDESFIEARDGVAIDRDLRTAAGAQKYDFEVVRPGARFEAEVFVENPEDWLMGLLMIGFDQIDAGFSAIGGFTSRGLGRATFAWTEIETIDAKELLGGQKSRLITGDAIDIQKKAWREALAKHVRA